MITRLISALCLLAGAVHGQQIDLRFLDVGQGDAVLLRSDGKNALIDAGPSPAVLQQLRALSIDTLDLVVASHNHSDHIGGMTAVLGGLVVRFYMDNGVPHTTATYQQTLRAVTASGAQYLRATARTITLGSARLRIIPGAPGSTDHNNASIGVLVEHGEFRALLTGDSELNELEYWLSTGTVPRVQVLKVAHHGSLDATSSAWVDRTRPRVAVISVGATNGYGHPAPQVVGLWESVGAGVYRTDHHGTVLVLANRDGSFVVTTERPVAASDAPVQTPEQVVPAATPSQPRSCCKVCSAGKACGNTCINRDYQCRQPPGCACD